jgi:MoxR-like ATPase
MFSVDVGYPSEAEEREIVARTTQGPQPEVTPVLDRDKLVALQGLMRRVPFSDDVLAYAVRLARATRPTDDASQTVRQNIRWGAGPRASQYLFLGARVRAALHGREVPDIDDVRAVAPSVLSHRIALGFQAEAEGMTTGDVVARLLAEVPTS